MKKSLATLVLLILPVTGTFLTQEAVAQTAGQSVTGFLLPQGSTYGSYTCPSSATSPCFVQYGATVPTTAVTTPSGTQDVNHIQSGGVTVLRGAGATGTGSERITVAQDPTTVAGSPSLPAGSSIIGKTGIDQTTPGTTNGVQTNPGSVTNTTPAQRTIVPLDTAAVTTGGTAVTALAAGHRTAGGFLFNPIGATVNLCINEQAVASGTTSAGGLTCILPGQPYELSPASGAVSVVTSDSSHPFSGYGLN